MDVIRVGPRRPLTICPPGHVAVSHNELCQDTLSYRGLFHTDMLSFLTNGLFSVVGRSNWDPGGDNYQSVSRGGTLDFARLQISGNVNVLPTFTVEYGIGIRNPSTRSCQPLALANISEGNRSLSGRCHSTGTPCILPDCIALRTRRRLRETVRALDGVPVCGNNQYYSTRSGCMEKVSSSPRNDSFRLHGVI